MTAVDVNADSRPSELIQLHRSMLALCGAIWLLFAAMEFAKNLYFSDGTVAIWILAAESLYIFLPWWAFSICCGYFARLSLNFPVRSKSFLLQHTPIALAFALIHIGILTCAYWVFWPERVARVTLGFVYTEQLLKWVHFEVLCYFAFVLLWRRRLQEQAEHLIAHSVEKNCHVLFATDEGAIKLSINQIDWLHADDNYVIVHANEKEIRIRSTLKLMLEKLDSTEFFQTHRSAVVNIGKVSEVGRSRIVLHCGARVPISRRRQKSLIDALATITQAP